MADEEEFSNRERARALVNALGPGGTNATAVTLAVLALVDEVRELTAVVRAMHTPPAAPPTAAATTSLPDLWHAPRQATRADRT